jgi:hypothetical protein
MRGIIREVEGPEAPTFQTFHGITTEKAELTETADVSLLTPLTL